MSVKFRVVKRQNPINRNQEKFYPQAQTSGAVTLETLSRRISRATSASRGDVLLVISSLVDEIIESLEEGNAVRLGDLGSMRISLKTSGEESETDVTSANIRTGKDHLHAQCDAERPGSKA